MKKDNTIIRLKKVLLNDKINMPNGLIQLMKKDISTLFKSYFEFETSKLKIDIVSNQEGMYDISVQAKAERIKAPKFIQ